MPKRRHLDNTITIGQLPQGFVNAHGNMSVVTPKGVRTTLAEAYKKYNQTPINHNDVPGLTDYLITQDQPDISEQALMNKRAGDRFVNKLGKERDQALMAITAGIFGGGALASGLALAPVATLGSIGGGIAGEKVFNNLYGGNWGQDVERWTNGYIPAEYGEYLNPGSLIGGGLGSQAGRILNKGTRGLRLARAMNKSLTTSNIESLNNKLNIIGSEVTNPHAIPLGNTKDTFQQFIANKAIRGEDVPGFSGAQVVKFDDDEAAVNYLLHNTVGRNRLAIQRALKRGDKFFVPENLADWDARVNKNIEELRNVRTGVYPKELYDMAGQSDFGGFFFGGENPFISINMKAPSVNKIKQHEGLHFLDANFIGNDFWTFDQRRLIADAYDSDFLNLPNVVNTGSLKDYKGIGKELWTTNADARGIILDKPRLRDLSVDLQNRILDKVSDEQIVDAVYKSNGYGRQYIEWLKANNKLTPFKINAFRQAMKYVGGYSIPLGVGYGVYRNQ